MGAGRTALATAINLYRAMEMTFWLPQAEAALAQVGGVTTNCKVVRLPPEVRPIFPGFPQKEITHPAPP